MPLPPDAAWLLAADRGGTFTDCCATDPSGHSHRAKILSSGRLRCALAPSPPHPSGHLQLAAHHHFPDDFFQGWTLELFAPASPASPLWSGPVLHSAHGLLALGSLPHLPPGTQAELFTGEPAPALGARLLTATPLAAPFPPLHFRLATTLATNALLEGASAPVACFLTRGFRDLLAIGDQRRPLLFARQHLRDAPLHHHTVEVAERLDASGAVLLPLDEAPLLQAAQALVAQGITNAAVALLHSDLHPAHEHAVRRVLLAAGFTSISLSSDLAPQIRILPRAQTAVLNAALAPLLQHFVHHVRQALGPACLSFHCLTSAGSLAPPLAFPAKDSLLSGPAGGVAGAALAASRAGLSRVLTLDMGGTSTDVARWDGAFLYQFEQRLGQALILAPALRIETVAAGGGSLCAVSAGALTVGPRSAAADPGPACYGRGGPLTLTDVNLLLDRLDPSLASLPLHRPAAAAALAHLQQTMRHQGLPVPPHDSDLLRGLLHIAVGRIAEALRSISLRDGCDPTDYTLLAFGGAGPQHACAIADELGITQILIPAEAGLLSATGTAASLPERFGQQQLLRPLGDASWLIPLLATLESQTLASLPHPHGLIRQRLADLRLLGQDSPLTIPFTHPLDLPHAFHTHFTQLYGYPPPPHRPIEAVSLRVIASPPAPPLVPESFPASPTHPPPATPLLLPDPFSTLILEPGWSASRGSAGSWKLQRAPHSLLPSQTPPPASLAATAELFRCRFQGLVDRMGELLRRTAVSTNVKERLDYSCALLSADGQLLVNAPHIPVHLGALGECLRRTVAALPPGPGDLLVTNHPAFGGSHLPDVTVIHPVFAPSGQLLAYTANRAHHAEIGGITPGSMPAFAQNLAQEGVLIPPSFLVRHGSSQEDAIAHLLTHAPYPTRALPDNLADLRAQAAAAHHGAAALLELCHTHGEATLRQHLADLPNQARQALAHTLAASPLHDTHASGSLDDGTPIAVHLSQRHGRLRIDFTGSGPVHPGNRNATPAILRSAVLYVLRLWTDQPIPLNEGFLHDVDLILPSGFLNPTFTDDPATSPAVVGGNVETSQRVVDLLIHALGLQAGSQGTMNNVIFGNDHFGHYETVGGGSGAGPGYPGSHAIHSHMTNTAITDVEILERRYPLRLESFAIRPHSGGPGQFPGGCGAIRIYHFLAPLTLSLLTEHRLQPPLGFAGGHPGACGLQFLILPDGSRQDLPSTTSLLVAPGTRLHLHTPGGGGWGPPPSDNPPAPR